METVTTPRMQIDKDYACFVKATAKGEPTFTIRAQDVTAPLVIDFWIKVVQKVREHVKAGLTPEQAVKTVRAYYFLEPHVLLEDAKLAEACELAGKMENWKHRRLPD